MFGIPPPGCQLYSTAGLSIGKMTQNCFEVCRRQTEMEPILSLLTNIYKIIRECKITPFSQLFWVFFFVKTYQGTIRVTISQVTLSHIIYHPLTYQSMAFFNLIVITYLNLREINITLSPVTSFGNAPLISFGNHNLSSCYL